MLYLTSNTVPGCERTKRTFISSGAICVTHTHSATNTNLNCPNYAWCTQTHTHSKICVHCNRMIVITTSRSAIILTIETILCVCRHGKLEQRGVGCFNWVFKTKSECDKIKYNMKKCCEIDTAVIIDDVLGKILIQFQLVHFKCLYCVYSILYCNLILIAS